MRAASASALALAAILILIGCDGDPEVTLNEEQLYNLAVANEGAGAEPSMNVQSNSLFDDAARTENAAQPKAELDVENSTVNPSR